MQRLQTGSWSAFFDVQSKYSPGIHDPAGITVNTLLPLVRTAQPFTHYLAGSWQTLLLTAVLVAVFAHAFLRWRSLTRLDALLLVFSALAWLVPLTQANTSIWRSQTALAPVALLVAKLPRPMAVSVVAACVVVDVAAARLFFEGRLI